MEKIVNSGEAEYSNIRFEDLFDIDEIQRIQDQFASATGVASIITRPDGTPITRPSRFCQLCLLIRSTEKGLQNCYKSDAVLGRSNPDGAIMQPCLSGGLWDGGSSITVGGVHIANWLIGQVRNSVQDRDQMLAYCDEIGANRKLFEDALAEVAVMPVEQFKKVCDFLFLFANQVSRIAYQNYRMAKIIEEKEKTELELARAKSYIDNIINSMPSVLIGVNKNLEVTQWNHHAAGTTGIPLKEALGRKIAELMPQLNTELNSISEVIAERKIRQKTDVIRPGTRKVSHENITIYPLVTNGVEGAVIRIDDITNHAELEAQLAHSRKMDAIGQLAGGVAHDFNNMLGGVIGAADLLKRRLMDGNDLRMIDIILQSAGRASELTAKLLAFGRKGKLSTEPVNMNEVINDAIAILERSIDKKIKLVAKRDAERSTVTGDYSSLQSAILNIGINASHAMPDGGSIEISTRVVKLDQMYCDSCTFNIAPGDYIEVEIRDCGCGIHPENLQRIFDPFFTTKEQGKGTGLGLSAVYGTIQEHHGAITVYSEMDVGTVFHLYLPLSDQKAKAYESSECVINGHGRILVVDDEELIRITAQTMLEEMNYEVLLAQDGQEAVDIYSREGAKIDLIILDMIMPKMNGREAFLRLRELNSDVKIIISSGFSKDGDIDDLKEKGLCGFIRKPYRLSELSHILAQNLKTD